MNSIFKSHGKLLITGEYFVLKGAKSLSIPTKFFQTLKIENIKESKLIWVSYDKNNDPWIEATFDLSNLKILSTKNKETLFLKKLLCSAQKINSNFLKNNSGFKVVSTMNFERSWGLGSSSTLINNISKWANINPFKLHSLVSSGSGYDIASAIANSPIIYELINGEPKYHEITFDPIFHNNLFFIYINKKQKSEDEVDYFNTNVKVSEKTIKLISSITEKIVECKNLDSFQNLIVEHEKILSTELKRKMIKTILFNDYKGEIKSLGAWGGDFVLAAGPNNSKEYFQKKGYKTVFSFKDILKNS